MELFENTSEVEKVETKEGVETAISKEAEQRYDELLGEKEEAKVQGNGYQSETVISFERLLEKYEDEREEFVEEGRLGESTDCQNQYDNADNSEKSDENTDENTDGKEYERNGSKYHLDEKSRIVKCEAKLQYTEDNIRNTKEQMEAGGEERKADDDGGHIVGRVLGGAEGAENLVPMRRTINRGDYKKMENEIARNVKDGKEAELEVQMVYKDDSNRPSKIIANYKIEDREIQSKFENEPNSLELLQDVKHQVSREDYRALKKELDEMYEEGSTMTITSVKTEYDDSGNPYKVTVGVLEEETGEKSYKVYEIR